jgi:hypothetical protein
MVISLPGLAKRWSGFLFQNHILIMVISTNTLNEQLLKLKSALEKREDYFSERTDRWRESENGQDYEIKTQELDQIAHDLENLIESLDEWNNEN